ncbi:MAG: twin-arginine translocase subunit TatC, partial [Planctomycetota bacterium]|nr:twin-arginine translocase subunit TatC [Planctomycetota bacterium]
MREDVEMSFGEHLDELRRRVIYALLGLVVAAIFCGVNYEFLLSALMRPYKRAYETLISSKLKAEAPDEEPGTGDEHQPLEMPEDSPLAPVLRAIDQRLADLKRRLDAIAPEPEAGPEASEDSIAYAQRFPTPRVIQGGPLTGYVTAILLCVICGIILGSPWILYQIWAFVGVGLYAHERRYVNIYGPFSFVLFISGTATFYFVMLPVALGALMAPTSGIMVDGTPIIDPSLFLNDYFKFVAMMTLIFGVVFQTPLVVMFIAWTGIVPLGTLVRKQRIVILVLAVASAVLTPSDPVTMVMMAIP